MSLNPGDLVRGRYEVVRSLGNGTYGDVYEVFDQHQHFNCALKLFDPSAPVADAWEEASVLTGMRGDGIVRVWNADHDAGQAFIVTDLMKEGSVDQRIPADVGVDIATSARWITEAALGVARLHDKNLLHNDIKPANIFLNDIGGACMGDMGLAKLMDPHGYGPAGGTAATIAPEVASGYLTSDPACSTIRSDVYSLGASLYWLLAGRPIRPIPPPGVHPATHAATTTTVRLFDVAPHVPIDLDRIVMRALSPDPADRYATVADFSAAVRHRTTQAWTWQRTPAHSSHQACFEATSPNKSGITVCAVQVDPTTIEIQSKYATSGKAIKPWPRVHPRDLAKKLRSRLKALT